jgi:hypothetical protein
MTTSSTQIIRLQSNGAAGTFLGVELVTALLLYPSIIVDSAGLSEISSFLTYFGQNDTLELLESGALKFDSHVNQIGSADFSAQSRQGTHLYRLVNITGANRGLAINRWMTEVEKHPSLSSAKGRSLVAMRRAVHGALLEPSLERGNTALQDTIDLLTQNSQFVKESVVASALSIKGLRLNESDLEIEIIKSGEILEVKTNLFRQVGVDAASEYRIIQDAFLGAAGVNHRIEVMGEFNASAGFKPEEFPYLERRIKAFYATSLQHMQSTQFHRILEVADVPDVDALVKSGSVNIGKLLAMRESPEFSAFRNKLSSISSMSDEEVREFFDGFSQAVQRVYAGKIGKLLRFAIPTAIDAVLPLVGTGVGALDSFIVEKFVSPDPAVVFLKQTFPSIFKGQR